MCNTINDQRSTINHFYHQRSTINESLNTNTNAKGIRGEGLHRVTIRVKMNDVHENQLKRRKTRGGQKDHYFVMTTMMM